LRWDLMKMEFIARLLGAKWTAPKIGGTGTAKRVKGGKTLGEYCGGKYLDECSRVFGDRVNEVCAACPD
jgi:hypothetical protein